MTPQLPRKPLHQALLAALLIALCLSGFFMYRFARRRATASAVQRQPWMTVMVHGSFGTTLGLFSVFNVIKDNVDDTNYKKMTSHMRHDPFFYQHQAILAPGMYPVIPTFEPPKEKNKPAILPTIAAYKAITEKARPAQEQLYFYSFGWSGLISQQRRRKEALRFYNMLLAEYNALRKKGIIPKVRIIAHSHGGNVILNAAGIHELLEDGLATRPNKMTYPDDDHRESMQRLHEMLRSSKKKELITHLPHQKKWDYRPALLPFKIDELILLGTPIQPETSAFFLSSMFKKIYNIYSDDDVIQGMDWVSTRRYYSEQRLECSPVHSDAPTLIQAKITLNKPEQAAPDPEEETPTEKPAASVEPASPLIRTVTETVSSVWETLFGPKKARPFIDPNHKELWFMGWKGREKGLDAQQHIKPYPYVVFVPIIQKLINQHDTQRDFDVRIKFKDEAIDFMTYQHNDHTKQRKISLPRPFFRDLQKKASAWQPDNIAAAHEMNILHRYSKMLNI